jgi:hypothetical protein
LKTGKSNGSRHHLCRVPVHHGPEINPQFRGQVLNPDRAWFSAVFLGTTEAGIKIWLEGPIVTRIIFSMFINPIELIIQPETQNL